MAKKARAVSGFMDEIPLMIDRACRLQGLTKAQLGKCIGYSPESISRLASGDLIDGMPIGKLRSLMTLAQCEYEWRRL